MTDPFATIDAGTSAAMAGSFVSPLALGDVPPPPVFVLLEQAAPIRAITAKSPIAPLKRVRILPPLDVSRCRATHSPRDRPVHSPPPGSRNASGAWTAA